MRTLLTTLRSLARQPGITVPAVLTLALGIGANTALFAYLAAVVWPRVEAPHAERVVFLQTGTPEAPGQQSPYPDYRELLRGQRSVVDLAVFSQFGASVGLPEQTTFAWGQYVNGGFFRFMGARPALGRLLGPADDQPGAPVAIVLSHAFWQGAFGGSPSAIGRELRINGRTATVVGVTPPHFNSSGLPAALYAPIVHADEISGLPRLDKPDVRWINISGRLAPGVSLEQAQADCDRIAKALDATSPLPDGKRVIHPLLAGRYAAPSKGSDPYLDSARILLAAAALFLLLGCASIANLLLARATARQRELAIRASLGADRRRLAGGVFLESLLLCLAGGLAGLPLAAVLARRINAYLVTPPAGYGNWGDTAEILHLDARSLTFALAISLLCAALGGLGPLLRLSRRELLDPLKSDAAGSGTGARTLIARRLLVVAQVALSMLLLVGGGLLVRSLEGARRLDPGFSTDRLLLATVYIPKNAGIPTAIYSRALEEVRRMPGIGSATLTQVPPLAGWVRQTQVAPHDKPEDRVPIGYNLVAPDYFSTLGLRIVQGRALDRRDGLGAPPVVVINHRLAEKLWGHANPIGRLIDVAEPAHLNEPGPVFEVVGVTADARLVSPVEEPGPLVYFSNEQRSHPRMTVMARTTAPPPALAGALRQALRAVHPDLSVVEMTTCREQIEQVLVLPRMYAEVAGLFGLLGLAVAVVGLFGLLSYSVSLRRREMGIRMAVGAGPREVRRLVVRQGMALVAAGIALGLAGALALSRLLANLLFGIGATDPLTFLLIPLLLAAVALLACDLPARRAARLDPASVLRNL